VWGIWIEGRHGLSGLLVEDALNHELMASADRAISLNPSDPEAYYARASLNRKSGQTTEVIKDLQHAVDLRPRDYFLRLELGYTRYQAGDIEGATRNFQAAASFAPFYAQPRWYLGNMLLHAGRLDDGFAELRRAVKSDPSYLPDTIQRATEAFDGDGGAIVRAINPESWGTRLGLSRYFIRQGDIAAAMELFRAGKDMPAGDVRTLLSELLTAHRFVEAYEVWLVERTGVGRPSIREATSILDGGFESEIDPDAIGFEWQLERRLEKFRALRDSKEFYSGGYSLRVDYYGESNPSTKVVSQLVFVEPNTNYRLSFAAQTREVVTGGLPLITVSDATDGHLLAQSTALPEGTSSWRNYEVDCKTPAATRAVIIGVERGGCSQSPCPAFGHVWLDDFIWRSR
jgi:hypothetical protein